LLRTRRRSYLIQRLGLLLHPPRSSERAEITLVIEARIFFRHSVQLQDKSVSKRIRWCFDSRQPLCRIEAGDAAKPDSATVPLGRLLLLQIKNGGEIRISPPPVFGFNRILLSAYTM
jgi:hypothetical protein